VLERAAHQLVGSGGSYGFDAITAAARELEAGMHADPPDVALPLAKLLRLCEGVLAAHG